METCNIFDCDLFKGIDIIKSRWAPFVLMYLDEEKRPLSFSEILSYLDFLTNTQLSRCLNNLHKQNLLDKIDGKYALNKNSEELITILNSITSWYSNLS